MNIYIYIYISIYLYIFIYLNLYVYIYISIYLYIYISICIYLSNYLYLYLSIYLSIFPSIYLSNYLSIYRSIRLQVNTVILRHRLGRHMLHLHCLSLLLQELLELLVEGAELIAKLCCQPGHGRWVSCQKILKAQFTGLSTNGYLWKKGAVHISILC